MPRLLNNSKSKNKSNKTIDLITPRRIKNVKTFSDFYINNECSIEEVEPIKEEKNQDPKNILSTLLKNLLDKPLSKLQDETKKHMDSLNLTVKCCTDLEKKIKALISGVERKKKEDEEKRLNLLKRLKRSKTPLRSKTYFNIRTPKYTHSLGSFSHTKNNRNKNEEKKNGLKKKDN